ncbi:hypothetical protein AB0F88_42410 [Streptosporangium sp. NPDC023963]|uniref:hypothetical protein n=1 Tax=Streptosporangium sp. NPDC023963 TaxID=3155608 RepID=UPI0034226FAE
MVHGQNTTEPRGPSSRRAPGAPSWLVIVLVAVLGMATGSVLTLLLVGNGRVTAAPTPLPSPSASARAALGVDVCAMLDPDEADRLVPRAEIRSRSNSDRTGLVSYVYQTCTWTNNNISYREVTRTRKITVEVTAHEGIGTTTAAKAAANRYDGRLSTYRYGAKNVDEELYQSKPVTLPGVGEAAAVHYQWSKGKISRSAYGEGIGRIGNITFEVRYQAGERHKEADFRSAETMKSITEKNALREAGNLLTQVAASVTAWRSNRPLPYAGKSRPTPTPTPTPTPMLVALPKPCVAARARAVKLVPDTEGLAARNQEGKAALTLCQWWNETLPVKPGTVRWRNLRISIRAFPDADSARYYFVDRRSGIHRTKSSFGGITTGAQEKLTGLGQEAFGYTVEQRTSTAHTGTYNIHVLDGRNVVSLLFGGSDRPEGTPVNSEKSTLMSLKKATEGAMPVMRSVMGALDG